MSTTYFNQHHSYYPPPIPPQQASPFAPFFSMQPPMPRRSSGYGQAIPPEPLIFFHQPPHPLVLPYPPGYWPLNFYPRPQSQASRHSRQRSFQPTTTASPSQQKHQQQNVGRLKSILKKHHHAATRKKRVHFANDLVAGPPQAKSKSSSLYTVNHRPPSPPPRPSKTPRREHQTRRLPPALPPRIPHQTTRSPAPAPHRRPAPPRAPPAPIRPPPSITSSHFRQRPQSLNITTALPSYVAVPVPYTSHRRSSVHVKSRPRSAACVPDLKSLRTPITLEYDEEAASGSDDKLDGIIWRSIRIKRNR